MKEEETKLAAQAGQQEKKTTGGSTWQATVSSAFGAALGAAGGMVAQDAFAQGRAATSPHQPMNQQQSQPHATQTQSQQPNAAQQQAVKEDGQSGVIHPSPLHHPHPQPDPAPTPEPSVEVVSFQTVTNDDGSQMDVAEVRVNGHSGLIVDADQDNVADAIYIDANGNGRIDEGEAVNLHEAGTTINMSDLRNDVTVHEPEHIDEGGDMQTDDQLIANVEDNNNMPDYTNDNDVATNGGGNSDYMNDANVDHFMA